jgi:hypothetical protein
MLAVWSSSPAHRPDDEVSFSDASAELHGTTSQKIAIFNYNNSFLVKDIGYYSLIVSGKWGDMWIKTRWLQQTCMMVRTEQTNKINVLKPCHCNDEII